jgi:hypothetical protein
MFRDFIEAPAVGAKCQEGADFGSGVHNVWWLIVESLSSF